MPVFSTFSSWALNFLWATVGRTGVSFGVPAVKSYLKKTTADGATVEDKLYKIFYRAFFLAIQKSIKDINVNNEAKKDLAIIQSALQDIITDSNYWDLIETFSSVSKRNLSFFKNQLQSQNQAFILSLSSSICSKYKKTLKSTNLLIERQEELFKIIFNRYYDALSLSVDGEEYLLFLDHKLSELEDILRKDDLGYIFSQRIYYQSTMNLNLLNQVEKDENEQVEIKMKDIYVERDIEQYILHDIHNHESQAYMIKGEAGNGKSSMLWSIYNNTYANSANLVWLIKAIQITNTDLLQAAAYVVKHNPGRNILILIDTIDNIVNKNFQFESVISTIISLLKMNDIQIVMTSRPHEAQILLNAWDTDIDLKQYALRNFNDNENGELFRAIKKYVANYCKFTTQEVDFDKYYNDIIEAVSNGRSLRNICVNPLKLRLLFSIYSPETIPTEINTFELYTEYWQNKIVHDMRGGDQNATSPTNLSSSVHKIAAKMLAQGLPLTSPLELQPLVDLEHLRSLRSRDVVSYSDSSNPDLEFFHQTFFEFAAANALFHYLGRDAISKLEEETVQKQEIVSNYFLLPIYEFLILISSNLFGVSAVNEFIIKLLQSQNNSEVVIGIRIYTLTKTFDTSIQDTLNEKIKNNYSTAVISAFIKIAYNIKDSRIYHLLEDLQMVWERSEMLNTSAKRKYDSINEKFNLIRLLFEYSKVDSSLILAFYKKNKLIDIALNIGKQKEHDPIYEIIVNTIDYFKELDRTYFISSLLKLFNNKKEAQLRGLILSRLINLTEEEKYDIVLEIFHQNDKPKEWPKLDLDFHKKLFPNLGNLWIGYWQKSKLDLEYILNDIYNDSFVIRKKAKLYGLIPLFERRDIPFQRILDWLNTLPVNNALKDFYDIILRVGLNNKHFRDQFLDFIQRTIQDETIRIAQSTSPTKAINNDILFSSLESVLNYTQIDLSSYLLLEDHIVSNFEFLENLCQWENSSVKLAARIYSNMLIAKNTQVLNHFEGRKGNRPNNKFWHTVSFNLNHQSLFDEEVSSLLIPLILEHNDLKIISNVILKTHEAGNLEAFLKLTIKENKDQLISIITSNIILRSGTIRRLVFQLYDVFLEYSIEDRLPIAEFIDFFTIESDTPCRKRCFSILYKYFNVELQYDEIIREIFLQNSNASIIGDTAIFYFLESIKNQRNALSKYDKDMILDFVFKDFDADKNFEKILLVVDMMKSYLRMGTQPCFEFVKAFIHKSNQIELKYGTIKNLSHKLRRVFIDLVQKSNLEEIKSYILFTHEMEPTMGKTWLSSIFSQVGIYKQARHTFQELIQKDGSKPEFKAEIEKQLAHKEKIRGHTSSFNIGLDLIDKIISTN